MENNYKLDNIDLEIVRNLWNGRTPYRDISDKIGLTTNTVRNRVNRMLENNVLQIISLILPTAIEGHHSAFIGIKILPQKVKTALNQIIKLKGVVGATMVSGQFDIMAVLMYNEEHSFERFLEEELSKVDGLLSTETFFSIGEPNNFQLRYVL